MKNGSKTLISKNVNYDQMPIDIVQRIFHYVSWFSLSNIAVSKTWYEQSLPYIREAISYFFPYLQKNTDFLNSPRTLFGGEYQRYKKMFPFMDINNIMFATHGGHDAILAKPYNQDNIILHAILCAKGYALPENDLTEDQKNEIVELAVIFSCVELSIINLNKFKELLPVTNDIHKVQILRYAAMIGHLELVSILMPDCLNADDENSKYWPKSLPTIERNYTSAKNYSNVGQALVLAAHAGQFEVVKFIRWSMLTHLNKMKKEQKDFEKKYGSYRSLSNVTISDCKVTISGKGEVTAEHVFLSILNMVKEDIKRHNDALSKLCWVHFSHGYDKAVKAAFDCAVLDKMSEDKNEHRIDIINFLWSDEEIRNSDIGFALEQAASEGYLDRVELLLGLPGVDLTHVFTYYGDRAISKAKKNQHDDIVALLEAYRYPRWTAAMHFCENVSKFLFDSNDQGIDLEQNNISNMEEDIVDLGRLFTPMLITNKKAEGQDELNYIEKGNNKRFKHH